MGISIKDKQAYSEIDEILSLMSEKDRNKIPEELRNFFATEKDKYYQKNIDPNISLEEQNLMEETISIIAFLNLKYWCEDEKRKEELKKIYIANDKKAEELKKAQEEEKRKAKEAEKEQEKIQEEVKVEEEIKKEETLPLNVPKESIFTRILNKIKNIFKH